MIQRHYISFDIKISLNKLSLIEWAFKPGDALRFRLNKRFDGFFDLIPLGNKVPFIGGMAHPHLPQTYYLITKNNFVALS